MPVRTRSLRSTLFLAATVPAVVLTAILIGIVFLGAWLLMQQIRSQQQSTINTLAHQINQYMAETDRALHLLSHLSAGIAAGSDWEGQQARLLNEARASFPGFNAIYLVNSNGIVRAESTGGLSLLDLDVSGEKFFNEVGNSDRVYYSPPFISATNGKVAITVAIRSHNTDGENILVGELNLESLQAAIQQFHSQPGVTSYIVDQDGTLVAHPVPEWVQERRNLSQLPLVAVGLQGQTSFQVYNDLSSETWQVGSVAPTAARWAVITQLPLAAAAQPLLILSIVSIFALGLSLALIAYIQSRQINQITAPIHLLAEKADTLSRGKYEDLPGEQMGRIREIVSLGESFTRMVEAVQERDISLEQRVADRTHRLQIIASISERLNAILDINALLHAVVDQMQTHFHYYFVSIFLLDHEAGRLILRAASGNAGQQLLDDNLSIPFQSERSLIALAARTGRVINIGDTTQEKNWLSHPLLPDTRSEIALPIIAEERVIGILDVQTTEPTAFGQTSVDMFRSLANQVGVAIHNAQIHAGLEQLVATRTAALTAELQERQSAEAQREHLLLRVREQAQQMHEIMNTVPEGVLLIDAAGRLQMANPVGLQILNRLATMTGDCLSHLGSHSLAKLLEPPPARLWHEINAANQTYEVIARPLADDELEVYSEPGISPGSAPFDFTQPERHPRPRQWVLVIRDVTEARAIQHSIQQQQRLAAIGQLAAGIAHDFNNILAVIVLYSDILLGAPDLPVRYQEQLHTISQQAHRASDLIQQILDFSRRAVLERRAMDLLPFVKEQVRLLQRTLPENIQIHLRYYDSEYIANADPTRMQQAIMNLAFNARDAMPEGGQMRITLEKTRPGQNIHCFSCGDVQPGGWVCITVSDTGQGIRPDLIPHIFEPFFTTKEPGKGTGLGLSQVFGITKQHDGHIDVFSIQGEGTTFKVYLPAISVVKPAGPGEYQPEISIGSGQTILVVEDEIAIRQALQETLSLLNYQVILAATGEEAVCILNDPSNTVNLVLSDIVMPGMTGIALFHHIQRQTAGTPVVLMTGHPMQEEIELLQTKGLSAWVAKPPDLKQLARVISDSLRGHSEQVPGISGQSML